MQTINYEIFGTLGPACADRVIIIEMADAGMTGMRLNLSHISLPKAEGMLKELTAANEMLIDEGGKPLDLLIDLNGPELRVAEMTKPKELLEDELYEIPFKENVLPLLKEGQTLLFDDGKLKGKIEKIIPILSENEENDYPSGGKKKVMIRISRGGTLFGGKSIKIKGVETDLSPLTLEDINNLSCAAKYGVTAVMQPFCTNAKDVSFVRKKMNEFGLEDARLFAKIESIEGVENLSEIADVSDMIVIARGDLGNDVPLYHLPAVQKKIENKCKEKNIPYLVVTEMLSSMIENERPTRAEVSDIFHAAYCGASAVMVTNETAVGKHPVEVMRMLTKTFFEGLPKQ
ncbi:MAG: pyruvate kinase [Lachnospiraceae bacterium]|nr:pyruvate kinase [Lachnospiraceae bacterium]